MLFCVLFYFFIEHYSTLANPLLVNYRTIEYGGFYLKPTLRAEQVGYLSDLLRTPGISFAARCKEFVQWFIRRWNATNTVGVFFNEDDFYAAQMWNYGDWLQNSGSVSFLQRVDRFFFLQNSFFGTLRDPRILNNNASIVPVFHVAIPNIEDIIEPEPLNAIWDDHEEDFSIINTDPQDILNFWYEILNALDEE